MGPWCVDPTGAKEFGGGKESWELAAATARDCTGFLPDVEEEQVAEEERSCYNCRYRRWSTQSFTCRRP